MKSKCIIFTLAVTLALLQAAQASGRYKVLHNFPDGTSDGYQPYGPLLLDAKGNLYGTTEAGGDFACGGAGCGTVFELSPQGNGKWNEQILHVFADNGDGAIPLGNLVQNTGSLYGTLRGDGRGTAVFGLTPGSGGWSLSLIYQDGNGPGLLQDSDGDLYGDIGPGQYYGDAIGELSPTSDGWNYTRLYSFCSQNGCPDGYDLQTPMVLDGKGNLYGTTYYGGTGQPACWIALGCGVAFQVTPNGDGAWTYHVLHRFASFPNDGQTPYGGLVVDASGNAYGVTWAGGRYGNGTFYKLTPSHQGLWKETILYEFPNCKDGCGPNESLVFDKAGNLYGAAAGGNMTCQGYSCGVIYKFTPQKNGKWKYIVLHKFNNTDGSGPLGVTLDGKGNIFGTTYGGGQYGYGVVFEIIP